MFTQYCFRIQFNTIYFSQVVCRSAIATILLCRDGNGQQVNPSMLSIVDRLLSMFIVGPHYREDGRTSKDTEDDGKRKKRENN